MSGRRRKAYPALTLTMQTTLRPLERLARYLNGEDPLVTAEQQVANFLAGKRMLYVPKNPPPRDILVGAFRNATPIENRAAAERLGALVLAVQKTKYPSTSPEAANLLTWEMQGRHHDPLWETVLRDIVVNPYRDRLRCCENPRCRRWFVDGTRNHSRARCSRACTIKVSNAKLTIARLKARRQARRAPSRTRGAR